MTNGRSRIYMYSHILIAILLAGGFSNMIAEHFSAVLPTWLFANEPGAEALLPKSFLIVQIAAFVFYILAVRFWVRPVHLLFAKGRTDMEELTRRRINGIYKFIITVSVLTSAVCIVLAIPMSYRFTGSFSFGVFLSHIVFPTLVGAYYTVYLTILYLEPYLFSRVIPQLYKDEELFRMKGGATLSIRLKLWLMVINLVVIPMLLVSASIVQNKASFVGIFSPPVGVIFMALIYILGYCEVLYKSITQPLSELVRKMERVAQGDFTVKTRIYSNDEIGMIKGHFNQMLDELAERERLKDTFGKYVSVEIAKQLMGSGKIELGGENIEATIVFSDIRNFTSMSEKMTPKDLIEFLNSYFSYITTPIMDHNGVINKFIGDAVMAVFAPQFGSEDHVNDALRAVLAMRDKLDEFNDKSAREARIRFGVGLHTGVLVAGNVGTEKRLEYTLIGDTVNIASRIESANKSLDSTILISKDAYDKAGPEVKRDLKFEKCENIVIRGKEKPLTLYKVK
ncbi:adenylate/guanylate cyclase domain-containing protein [Elusimicrobiota bacterium]